MKLISQSKIKQIRSLQQKKYREEYQLFVVEGEKMIKEILQTNPSFIVYCITNDKQYYDSITSMNIECYFADDISFSKSSSLKTPNKLIAVVKHMSFSNLSTNFVLALDSIQDPGNMGTIMRIADWFGIQQIVCSYSTVDVYNSKVIQSSMGAFLRIKVLYTDLEKYISNSKLPVYGALLEGKNVYKEQLTKEGILLMGNEGNGISAVLQKYITHPISIPRFGGAESLNVSVATGILLSEFNRG